jgi:hypothetical protein
VSERCPAGCCPHPSHRAAPRDGCADHGCPADLPKAPMPERVAHLYSCQGLSTYRIADVVGVSRQVVTRMLHRAAVPVRSRGSGRRRPPRGTGAAVPDVLLADLYLQRRYNCAQIAELTSVPARTVHGRLRAQGIRLRTRGAFNREDRQAVEPTALADMYLRAGLPAHEVGKLLDVSRKIVLRTAHDQGLPVRVGGSVPSHGPTEIELIDALYSDTQVQRTMVRYGLPRVPAGGALWQRFPVPLPLTAELVTELYIQSGLGIIHIELLTGQPAASVRTMLLRTGIVLRPAGGRSPFLRRWRAAQSGTP